MGLGASRPRGWMSLQGGRSEIWIACAQGGPLKRLGGPLIPAAGCDPESLQAFTCLRKRTVQAATLNPKPQALNLKP